MSEDTSRAFSRFDMAVVIGVLMILGTLFVLFNVEDRRISHRPICINNQSQLALAALTFETNRGRFPGWRETIGGKEASWYVAILPNVDQQSLYDLWNDPQVARDDPRLAPYMKFPRCPSNPPPDQNGPHASYVANAGFLPRPGVDPPLPGFDPREEGAADGVFVNRIPERDRQGHLVLAASRVSSADLQDGLSNTLLFSENLLAADWHESSLHAKYPQPRGPGYPRGSTVMTFLYASDDAPTFAKFPLAAGLPPPGLVTPAMKINFGRRTLTRYDQLTVEHLRPSSLHPGGVIASFADKHTQFLSEQIDYRVYQQLLTPNRGESHAPNRQTPVRSAELE